MNLGLSTEVQPVEVASTQVRILIIDDDVDQADVLAYRLRHQGFAVKHSVSARQGAEMAQQWSPDTILLDICMPDGDGLKLCGQLSDDPATAMIPVVLVSGAEMPQMIRQARSAGSRFFVRKPYDPNVLLLLIQQTLQQDE
jgi:CheY-like chemotaxis protein